MSGNYRGQSPLQSKDVGKDKTVADGWFLPSHRGGRLHGVWDETAV